MRTFDEAFEMLCRAYNRPPFKELHDVYEDVVGDLPTELVYLAAQSWIRTEDRMPSPHQWLTLVRQLQAAERSKAQPQEDYDAAKSDVLKLMMESTRRALKEVQMPQHWHGDGDENCPVCGHREEWQDRINERSAIIMESLVGEREPEPEPERLYECKECWDERWITTIEGGEHERDTFKPCPSCRAELHQRWAEGHFRPNHTCPECELIRRGR